MKTASGLTLIAVGAILAFAVTTNTPVFNLHIAGWVLIVVGLAGMFLPSKGYGWLRRRVVLRSGTRGRVVTRVDETGYPRPIAGYADTVPAGEGDVVAGRTWRPGTWAAGRGVAARRRVRGEAAIREPMGPGGTETIEEFTQE